MNANTARKLLFAAQKVIFKNYALRWPGRHTGEYTCADWDRLVPLAGDSGCG